MAHHDYYVYFHRRRDTNDVFYIGKGRGDRAHSALGRSFGWYRVACDAGRKVEYVKTGMSEADALALERDVIATLRKVGLNLVNVSSGTIYNGERAKPKPKRRHKKIVPIDNDKYWWKASRGNLSVCKSVRYLKLTFGASESELRKVLSGEITTTSDGWSLATPPKGNRRTAP